MTKRLTFRLRLAIVILAISISGSGIAQNKKDLETEYNRLKTEIANIEASLKKTQKQKLLEIHQLESIEEKIRSRQALIENINAQVADLTHQIQENRNKVESLEADITRSKEQYAKTIENYYRNLSPGDQMLFVLSANDFNAAFQRINYLRKYASHRKSQAEFITSTILALEQKEQKLVKDAADKAALKKQMLNQKELLGQEKSDANQLIKKLSQDEYKLRKKAKQKNKQAGQLNQKIQAIIKAEIEAAKKAKEGSDSKTVAEIPLSPKEMALSNDFASNKGKLPWPVERGHIISRFGKRPHPTLKGIYTINNGIDFKTTKSADVRAIFDGEVVSIFFLPVAKNSVIVKHGAYFTVYSMIDQLSIKKGDYVSRNQKIGIAFNNTDEKLTKVHIELWKGKEKLDPGSWLLPSSN